MSRSNILEQTFSYELFASILEAVRKAGYEFRRLDQPPVEGKILYLRHDIDISPACALRLGEITARHGLVANHFFQLNAETYNLFSAENLAILSTLRQQGHCVGLHIDEKLVGEDESRIHQTIEWFSDCCTPIDRAISFHRPSPTVLGRGYTRFVSAYDTPFWGEDRYLADSRRQLAFLPRLLEWLDTGRSPIQLLLHPEWWHPHPNATEFWSDLQARRQQELEAYMLVNFKKVFTGIIVPPGQGTSV